MSPCQTILVVYQVIFRINSELVASQSDMTRGLKQLLAILAGYLSRYQASKSLMA